MSEVVYSPELDSPVLIEQGRANVLRCPVRRDGQLAIPSAGTISIYDSTNTAIVSAAAVTVTGGIATYTTGTFASSQLGMRWRVEWRLTMPDGFVHTYRAPAGLVRCIPYPTVSDKTLYDRVSSLDPNGSAPITRRSSFQQCIDDAWKDIKRRLERGGSRVHLVVSQDDLEEPHLLLTLSRIFEDLGVMRPEYLEQARIYRAQFDAEWGQVQISYDENDDGVVDQDRRPARGPVWLTSRG